MNISQAPAKLILADGTVFNGLSFAAKRSVGGEVVFNTGMVGYPESLTDPSYRGQILILTYPLVGNYGVPAKSRECGLLKFFESDSIQVNGLIIAEYCQQYSHWSARRSLGSWLKEENIPAIAGVDTRELTKKIRNQGTMAGKIIIEDNEVDFIDYNRKNLLKELGIAAPILYKRGRKKIILVDCGVKNNIIRSFLKRDITVERVPYNYDINWRRADAVVISNGPGDPKIYTETITNVKKALGRGMPILGICLGSQILALAAGASTYKLKYGHRGQNQPCREKLSGRCYITAQNHGYAVDRNTLPKDWQEWFVNVNDNTNEGIKHNRRPYWGVQFHPEASPGPDDAEFIFDEFVKLL